LTQLDEAYKAAEANQDTVELVCSGITELPELDSRITGLRLQSCGNLVIKKQLPETIYDLRIKKQVPTNLFDMLPKGDNPYLIELVDIKDFVLPVIPSHYSEVTIKNCRFKSIGAIEVKEGYIANSTVIGNLVLPKLETSYLELHDVNITGTLVVGRLTDAIFTYSDVTSYAIDLSQVTESKICLTEIVTDVEVVTVLPSTLQVFDCSGIDVSVLPALPVVLRKLYCSSSLLLELPELPEGLQELVINNTRIKKLPKLPETLTRLSCDFTAITELPSLPRSLTELSCQYCRISTLPELPPGLEKLDISNTFIQRIPPLPSSMSQLFFYHTNVKYLSSRIPTNCYIRPDDFALNWCFQSDMNKVEVDKKAQQRYAACLRLASKVIAKRTAVSLIQRNVRNWIDKPICNDGKLGIAVRLGMRKTCGLKQTPMTLEDVMKL